uniref:Putative conserved secreted protein n=1 Tax=Culex tarsalis TaxID=7177 RepID=A0A1Q3FTG3_CULTA
MRHCFYLLVLVLGGSIQLGSAAQSCDSCKCPCEKRVQLSKDLHNCVNIKSVKTKGYLTADKNNMFTPNQRRYTFVSTSKDKHANWQLYNKPAWDGNKSYGIRNKVLQEFLYNPAATRNTYNRFVLTWKKDITSIPREGFWQFIPAGNNQYMIRCASTGEFLYVSNEAHEQVSGTKRPYTYRLINNAPPKSEGTNAALFELIKC